MAGREAAIVRLWTDGRAHVTVQGSGFPTQFRATSVAEVARALQESLVNEIASQAPLMTQGHWRKGMFTQFTRAGIVFGQRFPKVRRLIWMERVQSSQLDQFAVERRDEVRDGYDLVHLRLRVVVPSRWWIGFMSWAEFVSQQYLTLGLQNLKVGCDRRKPGQLTWLGLGNTHANVASVCWGDYHGQAVTSLMGADEVYLNLPFNMETNPPGTRWAYDDNIPLVWETYKGETWLVGPGIRTRRALSRWVNPAWQLDLKSVIEGGTRV